jgi:hypothetical protein
VAEVKTERRWVPIFIGTTVIEGRPSESWDPVSFSLCRQLRKRCSKRLLILITAISPQL